MLCKLKNRNAIKFNLITKFIFQMAGEVANYFIICIQLFMESPFD